MQCGLKMDMQMFYKPVLAYPLDYHNKWKHHFIIQTKVNKKLKTKIHPLRCSGWTAICNKDAVAKPESSRSITAISINNYTTSCITVYLGSSRAALLQRSSVNCCRDWCALQNMLKYCTFCRTHFDKPEQHRPACRQSSIDAIIGATVAPTTLLQLSLEQFLQQQSLFNHSVAATVAAIVAVTVGATHPVNPNDRLTVSAKNPYSFFRATSISHPQIK